MKNYILYLLVNICENLIIFTNIEKMLIRFLKKTEHVYLFQLAYLIILF